jgi:hypothetical protein
MTDWKSMLQEAGHECVLKSNLKILQKEVHSDRSDALGNQEVQRIFRSETVSREFRGIRSISERFKNIE